jgi:hypothetical protein
MDLKSNVYDGYSLDVVFEFVGPESEHAERTNCS